MFIWESSSIWVSQAEKKTPRLTGLILSQERHGEILQRR